MHQCAAVSNTDMDDCTSPASVGSSLRKVLSRHGSFAATKGADDTARKLKMRHMTKLMAALTLDDEVKTKVDLAPLYVVAFLYFDSAVSLKATQVLLQDRLFELPRFRSRASIDDQGAYVFEQIPLHNIDISELVSEVHDVKTPEQLDRFASDVYQRPMDPRLPLWRCYVMNDMADGRSMLCWVVDHCIADGPALVAALFSLLDDPAAPQALPPRARPAPRAGCFSGLFSCLEACFNVTVGDQLPGDPPNRLKEKNHRRPDRKKALAQSPSLSLERLKEVKAKYPGATVNDVLMAVVCLTMQEYCKRYDPAVIEKKQRFRGNFPINMRPSDQDIVSDTSFGNRFAPGNLTFPLHVEDPCEILWRMKSQIDRIKRSPEPLIRDMLTRLVVESRLKKATVADLVMDQYGKVTLMLSNVAGPQTPVKLGGQTVSDIGFYALSPLGLYFGILSYNGRVGCGVAVSQSCEPNAARISDLWVDSFEKLYEATMKHSGNVPRTA